MVGTVALGSSWQSATAKKQSGKVFRFNLRIKRGSAKIYPYLLSGLGCVRAQQRVTKCVERRGNKGKLETDWRNDMIECR